MLSDISLREYLDTAKIKIDPQPCDAAIQPASVDLRLGYDFIVIGRWSEFHRVLDPTASITLRPGACVLGTTMERIEVPRDLVARVEGKSTWGRQYLMVHSTAGFIDPGFEGQITLELKNLSPRKIRLVPGVPIAQISFDRLDRPAARPYGSEGLDSHYQWQRGATSARIWTRL